jgi:membrane associated rhomboid family serine protease
MSKSTFLILVITGLICVAIWAVGSFFVPGWLASYYVTLFGAIGFLLLAYAGVSQMNKRSVKEKEPID